MPITIQFEWTLEEFLEGQQLYNRQLAPALVRLNHRLAIPVGLLLLADGVAGLALGWSIPLCLLFLVFGTYLLFFRLLLAPRKLKKEFAQYPKLQRTMDFEEDKVVVRTSLGNNEIEWGSLGRFAESKRLFLLFAPPGLFWPIPKRVLSAEEVRQFRQLLERKLPGK